MADAQIVVAGLVVSPGVRQNGLRWTVSINSCLPYLGLGAFEIYAATSNNRSAASKIAETTGFSYSHVGLTIGQPWYYWVVARDASGQYSDFYPLSITSGVGGTPTSTGTDSVGRDELQNNAVGEFEIDVNAVRARHILVDRLSAISGDMTGLSVGQLSALSADLGTITAGYQSFNGGRIIIDGNSGQIVISD